MTPLEKVIRPIVEGQIRGFLKEHPSVLNGVDWYPMRADKATTFVNSLAKRIVRDLTCETTNVRLAAALLHPASEVQPCLSVEPATADESAPLGILAERGAQ